MTQPVLESVQLVKRAVQEPRLLLDVTTVKLGNTVQQLVLHVQIALLEKQVQQVVNSYQIVLAVKLVFTVSLEQHARLAQLEEHSFHQLNVQFVAKDSTKIRMT